MITITRNHGETAVPAQVLLCSIDMESFDVKERGARLLITPKKSKHAWEADELPLRSLVVDRAGNVLSSGFGKFLNYGENPDHDRELDRAMALPGVGAWYNEKMDGSLIVVDLIDGVLEFRTRGNTELGEFREPVMNLIAARYPTMIETLTTSEWWKFVLSRCSMLFEYVSPTNRIVVPYMEAELIFLSLMDKRLLQPKQLPPGNVQVPAALGPRKPASYAFETEKTLVDILQAVRAWPEKEGVVATFLTATGKPMMLKIKASQYVRMHALKSNLQGNVGKLLFILRAQRWNGRKKLFDLGVDYEAQEFVRDEIRAYFDAQEEFETLYQRFCTVLMQGIAPLPNEDGRERRRLIAGFVKKLVVPGGYPEVFFASAMKLYDGKAEEAYDGAFARVVLDETPTVALSWMKDAKAATDAVLKVRVVED